MKELYEEIGKPRNYTVKCIALEPEINIESLKWMYDGLSMGVWQGRKHRKMSKDAIKWLKKGEGIKYSQRRHNDFLRYLGAPAEYLEEPVQIAMEV